MIVSIHQPNFIPWAGFFDKLMHSDVFVLFDDVLFPRGGSYGNRANIKTSSGTLMLTVPIRSTGKEQRLFSEIVIADDNKFQRKTLKSIEFSYCKAPFFKELFPEFAETYMKKSGMLIEFNHKLIIFICNLFNRCGVKTPQIVLSSDIKAQGVGEEKIFQLLKTINTTTYISGQGAGSRRYVREDDFIKNEINLVWQNFVHPIYTQLYGDFISGLSIVDMLFNCGPNETARILSKVKNEDGK